jgi:8-hydroxy-5-deazaflavin:NADPH oxidoreductase
MRVAVVGGTGDFGLALAQRLVDAGEDVVIGSRDAERAEAKAAEIGAAGAPNAEAVRGAAIVVLAVKAEAALATAEGLREAIGGTPVLSVASELRFTKGGVFP